MNVKYGVLDFQFLAKNIVNNTDYKLELNLQNLFSRIFVCLMDLLFVSSDFTVRCELIGGFEQPSFKEQQI